MDKVDLEGRLTKSFRIRGMPIDSYPIIQGGMGFAISLSELASAVARSGAIGTVSSVGLDYVYRNRHGSCVSLREATASEIRTAIANAEGGTIAINIMRKVDSNHDIIGGLESGSSYEESVAGAILGGVHLIISGAGFPLELPSLVKKYCEKYGRIDSEGNPTVGVVPIISIDLALKGILRSWAGYLPDAIVVEGPSGGHQGWPYNRMGKYTSQSNFVAENNPISKLLPEALAVMAIERYNPKKINVPFIVAGAVDTHEAVLSAFGHGASGVQIATRFQATLESGASDDFKKAIVGATEEDIIIGDEGFGSPAGFPFAFLRQSPLYQDFLAKKAEYARNGGDINDFKYSYCICKALIAATNIKLTEAEWNKKCVTHNFRENGVCPAIESSERIQLNNKLPLYTTGRHVGRIKEIVPAAKVVYELVNP